MYGSAKTTSVQRRRPVARFENDPRLLNTILKSIREFAMAGKCPKCQNMVGSVRAEPITITNMAGGSFSGASYTCPHCQTILGVAVDPYAFKNEIAIELVKRMRGGR